MSLPLSSTSVPAARSIAEVIEMLEDAGFEDTAQISSLSNSGTRKKSIVARCKGVEFVWKVDMEEIVQALLKEMSPKTRMRIKTDKALEVKVREELSHKAERIGWRIMRDYVYAACIMLRYRAAGFADIFGGYLAFDKEKTLGNIITDKALQGTLNKVGLLPMPGDGK